MSKRPTQSPARLAKGLVKHIIKEHNIHIVKLNNLGHEWQVYKTWRESQRAKPEDKTWPAYYLAERREQLQELIDIMKAAADTNKELEGPLADILINFVDMMALYEHAGVNQQYQDPRDERSYIKAIYPMIRGAADFGMIPQDALDYIGSTEPIITIPPVNVPQPPVVPNPGANTAQLGTPRPIAPTIQAPEGESFLESVFGLGSVSNNIGARAQLRVARAAGFRQKKFQPLFNSIPPSRPVTEEAGAEGTGVGGSDNKANHGGTEDTKDQPFDIVQELANDPRPSRIDFKSFGFQQHPEDYDDKYYINLYRLLYNRTTDFAEKWFGDIDLPEPGYVGSPWQEPFNDQFIEYTRLVAHEDRHNGGWPALLRQAKYRKWLIVGILGQVIEKKVFSELLFGVSDFWKREIDGEDLRLVEIEGYRRKARRSETAKMALKGLFVPSGFWGDVDDLAWRTALIFEPLINLLDIYREQTEEHQTNLSHFYQELHMIISIAAYMQVCMAISPSVFHVLSATPGARMDYPIEQQADVALYRESKSVNERLYSAWEDAANKTQQNLRVPPADFDKLNALYPIPPATAQDHEQERHMARHHLLRGAKIMLAVFPMIKRYRPENRGIKPNPDKPRTDDNWEEVEGQRIADIFRCTVVYYQGLMYPRNILEDGVQLDTHLTAVRGWQRHPVQFSPFAIGVLAILLACAALSVNWLLLAIVHGTGEANAFLRSNCGVVLKYVWVAPRNYALQTFEENDWSTATLICRTFCNAICRGMCVCSSAAAAY
ncbi:hypothetical protein DL767_007858 [Monosporascus sp. MG133]|nr:hypothetical protein DL767_007858 [Monosporascus sp. MG133]